MSADPSSMTTIFSRALRAAALAGVLVGLSGCDWFTDFKDQPKIEPWESPADSIPPRGQPQASVPTTGSMVPGFLVSYRPLPAVIDSMSGLVNPVAADARSLRNGRKYYQVNCAVCHGDTGAGDGPATKYGMVPINLLTPITQARTDGYIWAMMRNGRGVMPNYVRIEEMDRWDVVNYVRGLQGKLGQAVATGPLAAPGVTGDALPGYTRLGPTVPIPHWGQAAGAARQPTTTEAGVPVTTGGASTQGAAAGARPDSVATPREPQP